MTSREKRGGNFPNLEAGQANAPKTLRKISTEPRRFLLTDISKLPALLDIGVKRCVNTSFQASIHTPRIAC
jgi:hypothetical protein